MTRRLWTIATRAEGKPSAGRFRLPPDAVRLAVAAVLLLIGAASSPAARPDQPARSVDELQRRDEAFRLIAGLEPVDGPGLELGIGAAGASGRAAFWSADREAARRAYGMTVELGSVIQRARRLSLSWRAAEDSLLEHRARLETTPSIVPASGHVISVFSRTRLHPILKRVRPHRGMDIAASYGSPILASARGKVSFVGWVSGFGRTIEIDHGRGIVTRYAHASRVLVERGQLVARGDTIGRVGRSGLAEAPHLHYEVLVNGEPKNPNRYIFNPNVTAD